MRRLLASVCALSLFATQAVAQVKFSQFTAAAAPAGTDTFVGVQSASNVKYTFSQLPAFLGGQASWLPLAGLSGLGTGVGTALGIAANASGGPSLVNGTPTVGNCLQWSATGVQDAGGLCGGGSNPYPAYVSNMWYMPQQGAGLGTSGTINGAKMACLPFVLYNSMTVKAMGLRIIATASGGHVQLAIYANSAGFPNGAALGFTGDILTTTAQVISAAPAGGANYSAGLVTLSAGTYWECINADATAGGVVTAQTIASSVTYAAAIIGATTENGLNDASGSTRPYMLSGAQTYGTWPSVNAATFGSATTTGTNNAMIHLQAN